MNAAGDALVDEIVAEAGEQLLELVGFGAWRVVTADRWLAHPGKARAYIEVTHPNGDAESVHLVAAPLAAEDSIAMPVFDDGAAADRAHDHTVDQENEVNP